MFNLPITTLRKVGLFGLSLLFLLTGLNHLYYPNCYISMVPPYLPFDHELSYISGAFQIIGAIAILFSKARRIVGYTLIIFLIAILPANIQMIMYPETSSCHPDMIYLRLPLQIVLILWVYWATIRKKAVGYHL